MTQLPSIPVVAPWPAGASVYPATVDGFTSQEEGQFAKVINDITASIGAIEATLGASPAGGSPTVKAAISNLQLALGSLAASQSDLAAEVALLATVPGPPNTYYLFTQGTPITTWVINHPLGRYPSVMVTDSAGTVVEGEITYNSTSRVTVTFSAAFAGDAYLS